METMVWAGNTSAKCSTSGLHSIQRRATNPATAAPNSSMTFRQEPVSLIGLRVKNPR